MRLEHDGEGRRQTSGHSRRRLHCHGEVAGLWSGDLHAGRPGQVQRLLAQIRNCKRLGDCAAQDLHGAEIRVVASVGHHVPIRNRNAIAADLDFRCTDWGQSGYQDRHRGGVGQAEKVLDLVLEIHGSRFPVVEAVKRAVRIEGERAVVMIRHKPGGW